MKYSKHVRRLFFLVIPFLFSNCAMYFLGNLSPSSSRTIAQLVLLPVSSISTYTCQAMTIVSQDAAGNPARASQTVSVALSGLGSGDAYSTLANCQTSTSTISLSAGQSSSTGFFVKQSDRSLQRWYARICNGQRPKSGSGMGCYADHERTIREFCVRPT
jgi:hypothetical protein